MPRLEELIEFEDCMGHLQELVDHYGFIAVFAIVKMADLIEAEEEVMQ